MMNDLAAEMVGWVATSFARGEGFRRDRVDCPLHTRVENTSSSSIPSCAPVGSVV